MSSWPGQRVPRRWGGPNGETLQTPVKFPGAILIRVELLSPPTAMALPEQLQKEFVAEFKREPHIVLRAVCDLTGNDGLTWLACDGTMLTCFTKPAGGEFSRHDYRIA